MALKEISRISPLHPDALTLIDGSERAQAAMYPPHLRSAFSPEELIASDVRFFVGYADDTPAACGGYAVLPGYAELKRIYVAPAFRGAGWADAIVATCEDAVRAEGICTLRLETGDASRAALKLYARLGYQTIPPFGTYVENGSSIFMEKSL